ncbi:MAG: hypothetical protein LPK02_07460 [Rhodobacterales bacterium]|nr:hypothetical protein [Rhodobacterales bacterium]
MSNDNKPIADFSALQKVKAPELTQERVGQGAWPDRPTIFPKPIDAQISIKGPADVIERFKELCKSDRRTYSDMLGILMDHFEKP